MRGIIVNVECTYVQSRDYKYSQRHTAKKIFVYGIATPMFAGRTSFFFGPESTRHVCLTFNMYLPFVCRRLIMILGIAKDFSRDAVRAVSLGLLRIKMRIVEFICFFLD